MNHFSIPVILSLLCCLPAAAQGLLPRWEVLELAKSLEQHSEDVEKLLVQVRPKEWMQDGAPEAYVAQHETVQTELSYLKLSAQDLGRHPEKLSAAIDTFLWLDRLRSMISSLAEGVRRYQNGAVADLLQSAVSRNSGGEDKLKEYMRQLAVEREAEMEIAHNEAQRCREQLVKQPRSQD